MDSFTTPYLFYALCQTKISSRIESDGCNLILKCMSICSCLLFVFVDVNVHTEIEYSSQCQLQEHQLYVCIFGIKKINDLFCCAKYCRGTVNDERDTV